MRDWVRQISLLAGMAVRTDPWRSLGALIEPLQSLLLVLMGFWLKMMTDGLLAGDVAQVALGAAALLVSITVRPLAMNLGGSIRVTLSERVGFAFDREITRITASLPDLAHHERADYQNRLELLRQSQGVLGGSLNALLNALTALVAAVGMLILLALVSPVLMALALFALPMVPVAAVQQRWLRGGEEGSAEPSRLARHLRKLTIDRSAGMELRIFGLESEVLERFGRAWTLSRRPLLDAERRSAVLGGGQDLLFAIGFAGSVAFVLWRAIEGQATVGDVVLAVYVCQQVQQMVLWPITTIAGLGQTLRSAGWFLWLRDYGRTVDARHTGSKGPPNRLSDGITLDNVSFRYPGTDTYALREVSTRLVAGSVVAIVGENGSGKTTLVKLLCRLYDPDEGRILVDGVDLTSIDTARWRSRLAAAFQDFVRLELLARESVGVGDLAQIDDEPAVVAALDRAGAGDITTVLPHSLATQLGPTWDDGVDLSTGQWQKLALGRALMRDTPLIRVLRRTHR